MPELPEVETVTNGVHSRVRGQRIERVTLGSKPEPLKSPAVVIEETLTGARIQRVYRVGKTIVIDLKRAAGTAAVRIRVAHMRDARNERREAALLLRA